MGIYWHARIPEVFGRTAKSTCDAALTRNADAQLKRSVRGAWIQWLAHCESRRLGKTVEFSLQDPSAKARNIQMSAAKARPRSLRSKARSLGCSLVPPGEQVVKAC